MFKSVYMTEEKENKRLTDDEVVEFAERMLENYSVIDICDSVDEQMLEYIDDDWEEDGFATEWEWYCEYGRGEAESDIINGIINEYQKDYSGKFDIDSYIAIGKYIADKAGINY